MRMRDRNKCMKARRLSEELKCVHNGIASRGRYARPTALEKSEIFMSRRNIVQIMVEKI